MDTFCPLDAAIARKSQTLILQRLASVGQVTVGRVLNKSETWVSRWKSEDSESCAALLAACGLKVVPAEHKCYPTEYIEHIRYFARIGMAQEQPPSLDWDTPDE